ncbi:hypothetical protein ACFWF7_21770 [Nocardia sp. NPDC060256]
MVRSGWLEVRQPERVNEGEGDFLCTGNGILAGSGIRPTPWSSA